MPIVNSVPGRLFDNVAGITMTGIGQFPSDNSLELIISLNQVGLTAGYYSI